MDRKFRVKLTRNGLAADYIVVFADNERADQVTVTGDNKAFIRQDGSTINFADVHMDKLAQTVKDQASECDAEYFFEDITGKREFRIKLEGSDFKAEFTVSYTDGNPVPLVTSPLHDPLLPMPDGIPIPFSRVNATDLQSFVSSMAKSNGLNFEFVDLHN